MIVSTDIPLVRTPMVVNKDDKVFIEMNELLHKDTVIIQTKYIGSEVYKNNILMEFKTPFVGTDFVSDEIRHELEDECILRDIILYTNIPWDDMNLSIRNNITCNRIHLPKTKQLDFIKSKDIQKRLENEYLIKFILEII